MTEQLPSNGTCKILYRLRSLIPGRSFFIFIFMVLNRNDVANGFVKRNPPWDCCGDSTNDPAFIPDLNINVRGDGIVRKQEGSSRLPHTSNCWNIFFEKKKRNSCVCLAFYPIWWENSCFFPHDWLVKDSGIFQNLGDLLSCVWHLRTWFPPTGFL